MDDKVRGKGKKIKCVCIDTFKCHLLTVLYLSNNGTKILVDLSELLEF
jgi:hypothetical protein